MIALNQWIREHRLRITKLIYRQRWMYSCFDKGIQFQISLNQNDENKKLNSSVFSEYRSILIVLERIYWKSAVTEGSVSFVFPFLKSPGI